MTNLSRAEEIEACSGGKTHGLLSSFACPNLRFVVVLLWEPSKGVEFQGCGVWTCDKGFHMSLDACAYRKIGDDVSSSRGGGGGGGQIERTSLRAQVERASWNLRRREAFTWRPPVSLYQANPLKLWRRGVYKKIPVSRPNTGKSRKKRNRNYRTGAIRYCGLHRVRPIFSPHRYVPSPDAVDDRNNDALAWVFPISSESGYSIRKNQELFAGRITACGTGPVKAI